MPQTVTEVRVEPRDEGHFVHLIINGATHAERGPMREAAAMALAKTLAAKVAEGPKARMQIMTGEIPAMKF